MIRELITSEYNFMTHENKYLQKIVLLKRLDIFLSLKTSLQRDNILSCFFQYGWEKDDETKTLRPIMLPTGIKSAPDEVLKISSCGCTGKSLI